jgi:hypothetical protein
MLQINLLLNSFSVRHCKVCFCPPAAVVYISAKQDYRICRLTQSASGKTVPAEEKVKIVSFRI